MKSIIVVLLSFWSYSQISCDKFQDLEIASKLKFFETQPRTVSSKDIRGPPPSAHKSTLKLLKVEADEHEKILFSYAQTFEKTRHSFVATLKDSFRHYDNADLMANLDIFLADDPLSNCPTMPEFSFNIDKEYIISNDEKIKFPKPSAISPSKYNELTRIYLNFLTDVLLGAMGKIFNSLCSVQDTSYPFFVNIRDLIKQLQNGLAPRNDIFISNRKFRGFGDKILSFVDSVSAIYKDCNFIAISRSIALFKEIIPAYKSAMLSFRNVLTYKNLPRVSVMKRLVRLYQDSWITFENIVNDYEVKEDVEWCFNHLKNYMNLEPYVSNREGEEYKKYSGVKYYLYRISEINNQP